MTIISNRSLLESLGKLIYSVKIHCTDVVLVARCLHACRICASASEYSNSSVVSCCYGDASSIHSRFSFRSFFFLLSPPSLSLSPPSLSLSLSRSLFVSVLSSVAHLFDSSLLLSSISWFLAACRKNAAPLWRRSSVSRSGGVAWCCIVNNLERIREILILFPDILPKEMASVPYWNKCMILIISSSTREKELIPSEVHLSFKKKGEEKI